MEKVSKRIITLLLTAAMLVTAYGIMSGSDSYAATLADGVYKIKTITDPGKSTMFKVYNETGRLTVKGGEMTATFELTRTGFDYAYLGTAYEAGQAAENSWIKAVTGERSQFTIPVSALDTDITISGRSAREKKWYEHLIHFYSDSMTQLTAIGSGNCNLINNTLTYTGQTLTPSVKVTAGGKSLVQGTDYTVTGPGKSIYPGSYNITFTGIGDYYGTASASYRIIMGKTSLSKLKSASKKTVKVTWKKLTKGTTGYQIRYSKKNTMKGSKIIKVTKNKVTNKTVKKLTSKKKYYFQIRTYKKSGSNYYYSSWSTKKSVKVK